MAKHEESVRIQTSVLNGIEKKVLVWLAERQPGWMTSDILTCIGTVGAVIIAAGFILAGTKNINWLWFSSLGFVINWYGDSLDGTLARVRNRQRPVYGYYLDHTVDAINEVIMFVGAGLSGLVHFEIAMAILVVYLMLTINVSVNAHLKKEFCLTYIKMGPTEFRIIMIIVNTVLIYVSPIREFSACMALCGREFVFSALDIVALLKERFKNEKNNPFKDLKSADFSEIYLFFDYDFQNNNLSLSLINRQIADMLSIFDNETENGKLYINYPMIESIRYTKELPDEQYHTYTVTQADCHQFKHLAGEFSFYKNLNFIILENNAHKAITAERLEEVKNNWQHLTDMNVTKANYLCHNVLSRPALKSDINQLAIFNAQVEKYVSTTPVSIAVLNAFPLFIYEYFK